MRTVEAQPGHTTGEVTALLASRQFVFADCYTITLKNGDKIRTTSAQDDMVVTPIGGGVNVTFTSKGVKVSGLRMNIGIGVEVDEQEIQLEYTAADLIQGYPIARTLLWGRFDGATVTRDRYFAVVWGGVGPTIWVGASRMFSGKFSQLSEVGRSYCRLSVKSDLVLLNIKMPIPLYQPTCKNAIYDAGCGLNRASYSVDGLVGAGSTPSQINWTGATAVMALGTLYIVSAAGVTLVRTIKKVTVGSALFLSNPLEEMPAVGATFTTYQGCDRSYARCTALGNTANNFSYPFIPVAETAY